jgi:FixJ family two-component response regulator
MSANDVRFDCLVLDLHFPGFSGVDLSSLIRRDGERTPIVCLTGDRDAARCDNLRAAGVSCLAMPIDDVTFFRAITGAVDSAVDHLAWGDHGSPHR